MAKTNNLTDFLDDLAKGIRVAETGSDSGDEIEAQNFRSRIEALSSVSATASAGDILVGETAYVNAVEVTGTMPNNGTVAPAALNAGDSYTIPAGYHNGSGKVTANSLASQTSATAAASDILSGKTAWVDGSKITGTIPSQAAKTVTPSTSEQTAVAAGKYTTGAVTVAAIPNQKDADDVTVSGKTVSVPAGYYSSDVSKSVAEGVISASASFDSTTGEFTASAGVSTAGYVTITDTKSDTYSLTLKDADDLSVNGKTVYVSSGYYPSEVSKAIADGSSTVSGGELTPGSGSVSATGTNITLTEVSAEPSSGTYITVTGYGTVSREAITKSQSAGFINDSTTTVSNSTSKTSNTATKYYTVEVAGIEYLHGVYEFVTAPEHDYLPDSTFFTETSASSLVFGWTGGTTGSAGTVYENETTGISVYYSSNYGLYIKYGSKIAYSNTTYGDIVDYIGWQALDGTGTQCRTIIIASPQAFSTDDTFYKWFSSNTTRIGDWTGGGGGGGDSGGDSGTSIETGTISMPYGIPDTLCVPVLTNGAPTYQVYSATSDSTTISDVIVGAPFTLYAETVSDNNYLIIENTNEIGEIHYDSASEIYIGYLQSSSGGIWAQKDCCFDGTSWVLMSDGTHKALSDLAIGDTIMTYNEETGTIDANEVTALGTAALRAIKILTLEDGTEIRMNAYHPMWTEEGWKSIIGYKGLPILTTEDKLLNSSGEYVAVKEICSETIDKETYYTIKIANNNNFYVNGYLAQGKDKD